MLSRIFLPIGQLRVSRWPGIVLGTTRVGAGTVGDGPVLVGLGGPRSGSLTGSLPRGWATGGGLMAGGGPRGHATRMDRDALAWLRWH
jgi:hypothetical protein